jgi:hypothetical protein
MKSKKSLLTVAIAIICLFGVVALANPTTYFFNNVISSVKSVFTSDKNQIKDEPIKQNNQNVPDKIVYFILFNHLVGLKNESEKLQSEGKSPIKYLEIYQKQANIDEIQTQYIFQLAQRCLDEVKPIDENAKKLIDEVRAKFPNGQVKSAEDIPPPPTELKELQKKKDETILRFRDELKNFLGETKFAEFEQLTRQKIVPQVQNLSKGGTK